MVPQLRVDRCVPSAFSALFVAERRMTRTNDVEPDILEHPQKEQVQTKLPHSTEQAQDESTSVVFHFFSLNLNHF